MKHLGKFQLFHIIQMYWIVTALIVSGCSQNSTPSPEAQIRAAVAATLASYPTSTPYPVPTMAPTQTPHSLEGIFCEYGFCIGHPQDIYLMDQGSTRQPPVPSTYSYGILFSYSQNIFIEMAWTTSAPIFDPQQIMHIILEEKEAMQGSLDAQLISGINVYSQPISTVSSALPFGVIAAWQCGGRDFAWKVYTPADGLASGILKQSLDNFRCQNRK